MSGRRFLTAREVSERTTVATSTLCHWARQGKGPASVKFGRRRAWPEDELNAWIAEQEAAARIEATA